MHSQSNPWISISDLLSSVLVVILFLLIVSAMIPKMAAEAERKKIMQELRVGLSDYETRGMLTVFSDSMRIDLGDVTFASGSAAPDSSFEPAFIKLAASLSSNMIRNPNLSILIEGHTDPMPVRKLVNSGGYYETNFQLSTLRAINVRNAILSHITDSSLYSRIGASGYGETRMRNRSQPYAPENRRIEIRLMM